MSAMAAAAVALALLTVFGVLGFGWRAWLQRRRTGSTGFRGISGRIGSLEWVAGVGFVVALVVAVRRTRCCSTADHHVPVRRRRVDSGRGNRVGELRHRADGLGAARHGRLLAHRCGRERDDRAGATPAYSGLVRNPIYTAMLIFDFGIALLTPNFVTIAGLVLALAALELQVRRVEEPYLLRQTRCGLSATTPPVSVASSPASG